MQTMHDKTVAQEQANVAAVVHQEGVELEAELRALRAELRALREQLLDGDVGRSS
jgi:uncharacterized membrane protein